MAVRKTDDGNDLPRMIHRLIGLRGKVGRVLERYCFSFVVYPR
jgi:hypothetical protein